MPITVTARLMKPVQVEQQSCIKLTNSNEFKNTQTMLSGAPRLIKTMSFLSFLHQ